jgi:hypothetical protein
MAENENQTETKTETETLESKGVRYYPLDVSKLVKGQVLTIPELEPILGLSKDDRQWSLKLVQLQRKIEKLRERTGLPLLTMRTEKGTLVICDDAGASDYNRSMGKRGLRRFGRASVRNIAVDVTKLPTEMAAAHGHTLRRQAMLITAIRSVQHRALTSPETNGNGRVTPKMIGGPSEAK